MKMLAKPKTIYYSSLSLNISDIPLETKTNGYETTTSIWRKKHEKKSEKTAPKAAKNCEKGWQVTESAETETESLSVATLLKGCHCHRHRSRVTTQNNAAGNEGSRRGCQTGGLPSLTQCSVVPPPPIHPSRVASYPHIYHPLQTQPNPSLD